jgi:signal transduction histidine kinase
MDRPGQLPAPRRGLPPGGWLLLAVLYAFGVAATVLTLATQQPWLGVQLSWDDKAGGAVVRSASGPAAALPVGAVLTGVASTAPGSGASLAFEREDFIAEPASALQTYADYDRFLARQDELAALQRGGALLLIDRSGGRHTLTPMPARPVTDLPVAFWVQLVVGVVAWLIAAAVWTFRQNEASARYLLLSGWSTALFAPLAAVYSTRELALPMAQFRWLCDFNFYGGCIYVATMVALLWYYPRRLGRLALGPILVAVYTVWWFAQQGRLIDTLLMGRRSLVFAGLIATFVLGVVQWRGTRRDPVARAALQWFLLSWLVGVSLFSALIFVPQIFGVSTDHLQGYAFSLFLLVYGGLAFGILRFRLFDLGAWWFRILLWIVAAALFVALDLALLLALGLSSTVSLSLSLLVCGFLWLPLRGWLWSRVVEPRSLGQQELFRRVVEVSLAPTRLDRFARGRELLDALFAPLQVELADDVPAVTITDDGLALRLPARGDTPALRLAYPGGGRRLFTSRDRLLAEDMLALLQQADASRDAYNQGVMEERARIGRDLHDDIGSRLLTGLYQGSIDETRQTIRHAIAEMSTIINGLSGRALPLEELIAGMRHETGLRLEAVAIALDWPLHAQLPDVTLDYRLYRNWMSVLRELISNVLRHAGATRVRVDIRVDAGMLVTEVQDDGSGLPAPGDAGRQGHGLENLRRRLADLGGDVRWDSSGTGTRVCVHLPLTGAPPVGGS